MTEEALQTLINDITEQMPIRHSKAELICALSLQASELDHWRQRALAGESALKGIKHVMAILSSLVDSDPIKLSPPSLDRQTPET